jgi:hypothetical protein
MGLEAAFYYHFGDLYLCSNSLRWQASKGIHMRACPLLENMTLLSITIILTASH